MPFFQKQDTDYLDEISQKISVIEELIKENSNSSEVTGKIDEIRTDLQDIEEKIIELESLLTKPEEMSEADEVQ